MSRIKMFMITAMATLVLSLAGGAAFSGSASAAWPENCHGKVVAELTHEFGSLKNAADYFGISVQELQNEIQWYCSL